MPQNAIQFQPGLSLVEFLAQYGNEAQCEAALESRRWPGGFVCPVCGGRAHSTFCVDARQYWQCTQCRTQTSLLSGTIFQATKLPLTKWFLAEYLVSQNKNNLSALSLKRHLGVSYRTAWRVKHKLMEVMAERESERQLRGDVVADDAYLGGVHAGKPGRGSPNKVPFMAAVELSEAGHPLHVRLDPLPDLKGASILAWATKSLHPTAHLVTDALSSLAAAKAAVANYGAIVVTPRRSSDLDAFRWVNTIISNVKTAIRGTYHHFNFAKYCGRYLAEAQYRLNRRFDLATMVDRLLGDCVVTPPSPEAWLRKGQVRCH
jgi:transposase-like protein